MNDMNKKYYYAISIIFILFVHFYSYNSNFTQKVDNILFDYSHKFYMHDDKKSSNVIVVDIDEYSLAKLGQWPWPRLLLAKLLAGIDKYGPASVGTDIIFSEKDRTSMSEVLSFYRNILRVNLEVTGLSPYMYNNDTIFAGSIGKHNTVLSLYLSDSEIGKECKLRSQISFDSSELNLKSSPYLLCPLQSFLDKSEHYGFVNMELDDDGLFRRSSIFRKYNEVIIPTLSLGMLMQSDGNISIDQNSYLQFSDYSVKLHDDSSVLINWYPDSWYKKVSAYDVLTQSVPKELVKNKHIVIGSSAVSLHDQVSVTGGRLMAGVLTHVTLLDNFLHDDVISQPNYFKVLLTILSAIIVIIMFILLIKKSRLVIFSIYILVFLGAIVVNLVYINNGLYISLAYLILPLSVLFFLMNIGELFISFYERKAFLEDLNKSNKAILDGMVHVASVHDVETGAHIVRTKNYIKHLAEHTVNRGFYKKELTRFKIEAMYVAAPLHDVGKVGITDAILKKPGKLTAMEFEVMKTHPVLGLHIINNLIKNYEENMFFKTAKNIAHFHHEKWDGSGYPEGLKGKKIPIEARFMALADVYDALMSKRCYKKSFTLDETVEIILEGRGSHFDPVLTDMFMEVKDEFAKIAKEYADDAPLDLHP